MKQHNSFNAPTLTTGARIEKKEENVMATTRPEFEFNLVIIIYVNSLNVVETLPSLEADPTC
jgi:hypothetical protein